MSLPKTLFIGLNQTGLAWYRCALPASALGLDWVGAAGEPPRQQVLTGTLPAGDLDVSPYDVIVAELAHGPEWLAAIRAWREQGKTVLYEIDDWLHGVRKLEGHAFKDAFTKEAVAEYEACMAASDGIICSTPYLARRYRAFNRTWVCRNGIDLRRYAYTRPDRGETVAIGWAGASGHLAAARPWLQATAAVMEVRPQTRFVSVGEGFAHAFARKFGPERALAVPYLPMDVYAAALTHFDLALAPAGKGGFYKGKSDLRWLEASAIGVPTIADPETYPEIEHGVTGFHASTQDEMAEQLLKLVDDRELRERVGRAAHEHVVAHRSMHATARDWAAVLTQVATERVADAA